MPKLAAKDRKKVEKAEATSGGFEPLAPGKYIAELSEVTAGQSSSGNPMWTAIFQEIHDLDGERQPGRLWYYLNLPTSDTPPESYTKGADKWKTYQNLCSGRIKAFFEAFGFTVDSDTDEMIGERCVLQVGVETMQSGPRVGEKTNRVNGVFPLDSVEFTDAGEGDDGDEF